MNKIVDRLLNKFRWSHGEATRIYNNFQKLLLAYEYQLNQKYGLDILEDAIRMNIMLRLRGTPPPEAYAIVKAIAETNKIEGDVCEFGVAQGETSALIANEIKKGEKKLHLFDSFEGLPKPSEKDILINDISSLGTMDAYKGTMRFPEDMVIGRMAAVEFPKDRYIIHKGYIDKVLEKDVGLPTQISFSYLDFDFYEPIKDVLQFLDGVTVKGGIIIVDDYNYFSAGAKIATDQFIAKQKGRYTIEIPDKRIGHFAIIKKVK